MANAQVLTMLRTLIGNDAKLEKGFWQAPGFHVGVAKGIVAELSGNACHEWLITLLRMNPDPYILWVERSAKIFPTAIRQRGVSLERIKFISASTDLKQPIRMALESGHYPFVIAPSQFEEIKDFHRFHLLAEKTESTLFLMNEKTMSQAWPISLQLEINFKDSDFDITVIRQRYGLNQ